MTRTLLCCAALVLSSLSARAEQPATPSETVIRLTVQPMAAPRPALRYLLLPELSEMNAGNPIAAYLKCLVDEDVSAERETFGRAALRRADWAARLDKPDWQILLRLRTDGFSLLLPDVQNLRNCIPSLTQWFAELIEHLTTLDDRIRRSGGEGTRPTLPRPMQIESQQTNAVLE